jgi:uncharacterized SAM-binding protein YcdF (DUF218 family)
MLDFSDYEDWVYANCDHFLVKNFSGRNDPVWPEDKFDVAIAIGTGTSADGTNANWRSGANAVNAATFVHNGQAANLILSGGNGPVKGVGVTEAQGMLIKLKEFGLYEQIKDRIIMEQESHTTRENALRCLEIMAARNWTSAVICAEALHSRRVRATFRKQWAGTGIKMAVIRTFGMYGNSTGTHTTPVTFLAREIVATLASRYFYKWS